MTGAFFSKASALASASNSAVGLLPSDHVGRGIEPARGIYPLPPHAGLSDFLARNLLWHRIVVGFFLSCRRPRLEHYSDGRSHEQ